MANEPILPEYNPVLHERTARLSEPSGRQSERERFKSAYSKLFYEYFRHMRNESFLKHQKAVAFIVDKIISISRSFRDVSNDIAHGLIFLCDQFGEFAETYAWSRDLYQLDSVSKESIDDNLSEIARIRGNIFSWSLSSGNVVLVSFIKSRHYGPPFYYRKHNTFPCAPEGIVGLEQLKYTVDTIQRSIGVKSGWESKGMLVVPASQVTFENRDSISALFLGFVGKELQVSEDYAWVNSYIELDHVSLALLSLSDLGSTFEAQRQRERTRILEGTRQFTNIFVHSFGQCARRVLRARRTLEDFPGKNSTHYHNLKKVGEDLQGIAQDLRAIKLNVLSPLSEMKWNRTGSVDEAITQAVTRVGGLLEETEIDIAVNREYSNKLVVSIDSLILEKILENLIENSIKALDSRVGEKKIEIIIRRDKKHSRAIVEVEDNGCGLPADYEDWIYKTKGRSEWAQGPSTGVGLFACRALLKMFGGNITVAPSKRDGMSTCVELSLRMD